MKHILSGLCVLVFAGFASASPTWTGSGGANNPSTSSVSGDGTNGPAQFSYSVGSTPCCSDGTWTFQTTANATGPVALNWSYGGLHAYFQVRVGLTAFVTHNGITTSTPLVGAGPVNCCEPPSGGFGYSGQVTLPGVIAGDTYGFVMSGSNSDSNGTLTGTLTVTGTGTSSMSLVSFQNPAPVLTQVSLGTTVTGVTTPKGAVSFSDGGTPIAGCAGLPLIPLSPTDSGQSCSLSSLSVGVHSIGVTYSGDMANRPSANMLSQTITAAPVTGAPSLIRVVEATDGNSALVIGRVESTPNTAISVQASRATTCTGGALVGGLVAGAVLTTTDSNGYFGVSVAGINANDFVAVILTSPSLSAASSCLASSPDNDAWPKAFAIDNTLSARARDYIDAVGTARWYKFKVQAGQRIQVELSGLPADYDIAVFKDISQSFSSLLVPADASDLTKLSAESAPSMLSPSMLSPSMLSPSMLSPDTFSPSMLSPSMLSPSMLSPSMLSPSMLSPSMLSPSMLSPSMLSSGNYTPSMLSNLTGYTVNEIAQAFSSAQTRSLVGVSATPGLSNETVVVNSWNNTGNFYIRVSGRNGAFSTNDKFTLGVTKTGNTCNSVTDTTITAIGGRAAAWAGSGAYQTLILTDSSNGFLDATVPGGTLRSKLGQLASASNVNGLVVDVSSAIYSRVAALKEQAALPGNRGCPFAMNLVAQEIKNIVDGYRKAYPNTLKYIVIVGNDGVVPFFRYPDESNLGDESGYFPPLDSTTTSDASLRQNYVLNQDAYGSSVKVSLRLSDFPVPGLPVGRLIEAPADIAGMIDAYLGTTGITSGVVTPRTSMVTGYDFLADSATAVGGELRLGTGETLPQQDALLAPNNLVLPDPQAWNGTQLKQMLFSKRHDVLFLAGHFSANSALAADFKTGMFTAELASAPTNLFTNAIVFSAGCHSGYNIVDSDVLPGVTLPLDWPQAFAQQKATLIAGTGYQYGDTDLLEYSERLYLNFAKALHAGRGPVAVGDALVQAKLDYVKATPDLRGIHQKVLLESTLYGLPMLQVNMPSGRADIIATGGAITPNDPVPTGSPGAQLGLKTKVLQLPASGSFNLTATPHPLNSGQIPATYLTGPDGIVANPVEPVLPLVRVNVTADPPTSGLVLRGVALIGGTYTDTQPVVPFTSAPAIEVRSAHGPFLSPVFFPARMWTPNYFGALNGAGGTELLITPAQYRAYDYTTGTSTERKWNTATLQLFYSANKSAAAMADAPSIVNVKAQPDNGGVAFTVQVIGDPAAGIQKVLVTYTTDGGGVWQSLDLAQGDDARSWQGRLPTLPNNLKFIVQAVSGIGLVSVDDNLGAYYALGSTVPTATTLVLNALPTTAASFGATLPVSATLSPSVSGKLVSIGIGSTVQLGVTDVAGSVTVNVPVRTLPGSYQLTAAFSGDQSYLASSTSVPFTVNRAPTNLSPLSLPSSGVTTLTANLFDNSQPLLQQSVKFTVTGGGLTTPKLFYSITDSLGQATFAPTGILPGSYSVTASFEDLSTPATFLPATTTSQPLVLAAQAITFDGAGLPVSIPSPGAATFKVLASDSGQPVTVALLPNPNPACTLSASGTSYTLTAAAPGLCTIVVSAGGTTNYADAVVSKGIAIVGSQSIAFGGLADKTYGDAPFALAATGGASGQPVTFSVPATTAVCTFANGLLTIVGAGQCTVAANQAGSAYYNAAPTFTRSFNVNMATQTIALPMTVTPASLTFVPNGTFSVSTTASSGLPLTYVSLTPSCTVSATPVTGATPVKMNFAGLCTIKATQPGNANYQAALAVLHSVTIAKASQTITFPNPGNKTLGTPPFPLVASASSGLAVTFTAAGSCTVSGTTLTLTALGNCNVSASQAGDVNYNVATPVATASFAVHLSGVTGLDIVTITPSSTVIDSFDSSSGYAATHGSQVNVLSNGVVTPVILPVTIQANVYGNVVSTRGNVVLLSGSLVTGNVTAGGTITNSASIGGTVTAQHPSPAIVAPAISTCSPYSTNPSAWISGGAYTYDAAKGNLTVSKGNTVTLASGSYCFNFVTLSDGSTLKVNGPVKINMTGAFTASGGGVINPTLIPSNLQILMSSNNVGMTLIDVSSAYFTAYAPGATVTLSGSQVFGALVGKVVTLGKSVTGSAGSAVHYDLKLLDVWTNIFGF